MTETTETKKPKLASVITFEEVDADVLIDVATEAAKAKKESPYAPMIAKVVTMPAGRGVRVPVPEGFEPKAVIASLRSAVKKAKQHEQIEAKASTSDTYVWLLRREPPKAAPAKA